MSKEYDNDMKKLEELKTGEKCFVNWYEEGGGIVYKLSNGTYVLFSVPQFGGYESFEGCYGDKTKLPALLDKAYSWT